MARKILGRMVVSGRLETIGPLHVGTGAESPETDLPLARNGIGQLYVPGTSLAGALRGWCVDTLDDSAENADLLGEVFGPWVPKKTDDGRASHLFVDDALVHLNPGGQGTEIRDGVAIDRQWGVAATRFKFDRAILPKGTTLDLRLVLELPPEHDAAARGLLRHLLDGLRRGDVRLGACKTRGMGRVRLAECQQVRFEDVNSRAGILRILRDEQDPAADPWATADVMKTVPPSRVDVKVVWRAAGPVMVKSGAEGLSVDMLPLLSGCGDGMALVIPGSSLKGVLRSQAERIVRTLLDIDQADRWPKKPYQRFPAQLAEVPLVNELFGGTGAGRGAGKGDGPHLCEAPFGPFRQMGSVPFSGAMFVEDTYSRPLDGAIGRDVLAGAGDTGDLLRQLAAAGRPNWDVAHHVAIDRWTGGAAEAFLYSVLEPVGEDWSPWELSLDLGRLDAALRGPAVTMLLLLLRDLAASRLPIGFGGNRGLGEIEITNIELTGATEAAGLGAAPVVLPGGDLAAGLRDRFDSLTAAWQDWLNGERGKR